MKGDLSLVGAAVARQEPKRIDAQRRKAHPKATVRRERQRTECVTGLELPHAGQQLAQTSVEQRQTHHDAVGRRVDGYKKEGRGRCIRRESQLQGHTAATIEDTYIEDHRHSSWREQMW